MAKPIAFKPITVDFKADLRRRLEKAPEEHAAALLAGLRRARGRSRRGTAGHSAWHDRVQGHDHLHARTIRRQPEGVAGIRNLLTAAKILTELDPEVLDHVSKAMAQRDGGTQARTEAAQPLPACEARQQRRQPPRAVVHDADSLESRQVAEELRTRLSTRARPQLWSNKTVTNPFDIGKAPHQVPVGRGKLFLIAGPCVIESEAHARTMADAIQRITSDLGVPVHLQGQLRQGEPHLHQELSRPWSGRGLPHPPRDRREHRPACPHRRPHRGRLRTLSPRRWMCCRFPRSSAARPIC